MISAEEYESIADLQYEFEVNAQVAEELMRGYKAIRPAVEARFADAMNKVPSPRGIGNRYAYMFAYSDQFYLVDLGMYCRLQELTKMPWTHLPRRWRSSRRGRY